MKRSVAALYEVGVRINVADSFYDLQEDAFVEVNVEIGTSNNYFA